VLVTVDAKLNLHLELHFDKIIGSVIDYIN